MKIAVVTGASSGIGRDFVYALDKDEEYDEIWVVARRKERLEEFRGKLRAKVRIFALDLSDVDSIDVLANAYKAEDVKIKTLVNASGFGRFCKFEDESLEVYYNMIDLNVKATLGIVYSAMEYMDQNSQIYLMGSMSSFQPVPYINVYGAGKAFVLSFARALNAEMRNKTVRVMAVCPLWVKTEFFDRAVSDNTISYYNHVYKSEDIVKAALKDMKKNKDVSVFGLGAKLQLLGVKLLPHKLIMKIWLKQQGY